MTDPNRALQAQELESLRSIYGDDWRDLPPKKTAWGTEVDEGWWEVKLGARDDERVEILLRGKLTKMYPKQPPQLAVMNPKNLSAEHVKTLSRVLQDKARTLVGEEMIFTLADFAQDWMTEHHLSLPKPGEVVPTLMEEMAQREEAQRAAEQAQVMMETEERLSRAAEQNRLLTEKIQLDASRKSERARLVHLEEEEKRRQESLSTLADGEMEMRTLTLDEAITVPGHQGSWRTWALFAGRREALWTSYLAEPDGSITEPGFVKASLPTLAVQVIDFSASYYSSPQGKKKVDAVATEVIRLREIRSDNVLRILAVKRDKSPKGWERLIVVVERVVEGGRLRTWLPGNGFGEETARDYVGEVLAGLSEIHKRGATQKQIDLDLTLLTTRESGDMTLKLSGTGYARRIGDLHRSNPFLPTYEDGTPESWRSPEEVESPHSYSARRDMWHAGLLFLQMLFGAQSLLVFPNLQVLLQHEPGLSDATVELLNGLLHPNFKKRLTAEEALAKLRTDEDVTRRALKRTTSRSATFNGPPASPKEIFGTSPLHGRPMGSFFPSMPHTTTPRISRYRTDFEEVEFLGKGGFGEVVKARNRLDGRSYAIKKVKLRAEDTEKFYREVINLSKVSHPHIVRYYNAWLEDAQRPEPEPSTDESVTSGTSGTVASISTSEEDEDIFQPNFDDLSFSRRDHSRSASFPRIRFSEAADEDDESSASEDSSDTESEAETVPDPSEHRGRTMVIAPKPSMSYTDTTTDDVGVKTILYIQMEFVEKQTLREAIGPNLTEEEAWRLLKQVLSALAHLAANKIPSNILLDASGNVKIADFGLSTTDIGSTDGAATPVNPLLGEGDRTSNIGTGLYIAPEADMYSLGIIFFEMCFLFRTQMERVQILSSLRQPSISFPPAWKPDFRPKQRKLIEVLLQHDPEKRPTAHELLTDDELMPQPEKIHAYTQEAIAALTNPNGEQYPALINSLFNRSLRTYSSTADNRHDDYTFDNEHDDELQVWLTIVIQRLVQLFQRHGAVETYLPLLIPETTLLNAFPTPVQLKPAKLLDSTGKMTRLPSSDLLAMARSATRRQIERIKIYHVGHRYNEHPAGGQPSVAGELSFDIVSPIRSYAAEAELLEVVDKVISEFRGARGSALVDYEFHVSHESVLATILAHVPERNRSDVLKFFKDIGSGLGFSESRLKLAAIPQLNKAVHDELEQCCIVDEIETVRVKLESILGSATAKRKLLAALDEVAAIVKLARSCGINRRILFRPTMSRNAEFFRGGFMFECVRRGKQRDIIAFGGRYDSLLEHFKEPAQQMPSRRVFGVGMSIAVDQLARMVKKYESALSARLMEKDNEAERSFGFWTPARCDVYVVGVPGVDLAARLAVTGELWRAGIRADLQYDDERTMNEVERECLDQNTLFLVIPRANRMVVKVRAVLKRSEEEVPRADLCNYLRTAIAEQRRVDATYASAEGSIPSAQAAALSVEPREKEMELRLVLPPEPQSAKGTKGRPVRKHRHTTRSVYWEKASDFATSNKIQLPIIGVDLPLPLLSQLTLDVAWVTEEEPWRGVLASMTPPDRKYAEQVREAVREVRKENGGGGGGMFLYSVREARGFLLHFK